MHPHNARFIRNALNSLSSLAFLKLKDERALLLFHILLLSGSSFMWAVRTANSDISSYMPLRRGRITVFLQLLGPLNTGWSSRWPAQQLAVSISLWSDWHGSLELYDNTKREVSAPWQTLMIGAAAPSGLWLGPQPNTACHRLSPFWWNKIVFLHRRIYWTYLNWVIILTGAESCW